MKAIIIGAFIAVSIIDAVFMYAALKVASDEDERMGID